MNPTVHWPDESLPVEIHSAPGVFAGLETLAADGLLAMPRTGLGIGGLLLGRRTGARIDILKAAAISCSHAMGPSFVLTPEEIAESLTLPGTSGDCELVGWYCSKPSGRMALTANDHALFDALCREWWQVALLIRPSLSNVTMAAFAFRANGRNGNFVTGTARELVGREPAEVESAEAEPEVQPSEAEPENPPVKPPVKPVHEIRETRAEKAAPAFVPVAMPQSGILFGARGRTQRTGKKRRWRARLPIAAVLLATVAAAAFFTRGYWLPMLPRIYLLLSGISK